MGCIARDTTTNSTHQEISRSMQFISRGLNFCKKEWSWECSLKDTRIKQSSTHSAGSHLEFNMRRFSRKNLRLSASTWHIWKTTINSKPTRTCLWTLSCRKNELLISLIQRLLRGWKWQVRRLWDCQNQVDYKARRECLIEELKTHHKKRPSQIFLCTQLELRTVHLRTQNYLSQVLEKGSYLDNTTRDYFITLFLNWKSVSF